MAAGFAGMYKGLSLSSPRSVTLRRDLPRLGTKHRPSLAPPLAPEAVAKLKSDLEVARNSVGVLRDMLAGIDPGANPEAARDDVVEQLAEQCRQMRPRVVSLVQSAENEELLMLALELNDELGDALDRADAAVAAAADPDALVAYRAAYADAGADDATRETTPPVGDLVDLLTRQVTFAFLEGLHQSGHCGTSASHAWSPAALLVRTLGKASKSFSHLPIATPPNRCPYISLGRSHSSCLPCVYVCVDRRRWPTVIQNEVLILTRDIMFLQRYRPKSACYWCLSSCD